MLTFLRNGFLFLFVAWCTIGCDDTFVDPFENDSRFFTVFGYIDVLEIDHAIRVIPITRQPALIVHPKQPEAILDAEVFTIDLNTQDTLEWEHNLELLSNDTYGHIFRKSFVAQPGHTYRLEVVRSDGTAATATTTMPFIPDSTFLNIRPVQFLQDSTHLIQDIHMPQIGAPWNIEVIYRWGDGIVTRPSYVPYGRLGSEAGDGGWNMTIDISNDQKTVRDNIEATMGEANLPEDGFIVLASMGLRIRLINPDWDIPIDPFDPEIYAFPETLSNVQNGYGYFGSLGVYIQEWNACELSGFLGYEPAELDCITR